ncbi:MAG: glycosyltransferase family 2 protein [Candidatus Paceibacterota bacterium]
MMEIKNNLELTILMPCLNESKTIGTCIHKAQKFLTTKNVWGEILIADNGSTDGSIEIAQNLGARVVHVPFKGYGNALIGGINAAQGKYIIMGDADDSYNFENLSAFVDKLREGYDLVMGNRFKGGIEKDAMPFLHRYLGNPVLTKIGQIFFKIKCGDFHCGLRGFRRDSIIGLDLHTMGMEFASEMVIKSAINNLKITEVPTTLSKDGRDRPPHLRTWRDGWRHLRFMLLYSPNWLFLYPGIILSCIGIIIGGLIISGPVKVGNITFDIHTLLVASLIITIGFQSASFSLLAKVFAITNQLLPPNDRFMRLFKYYSLELGLLIGFILLIIGSGGIIYSVFIWGESSFGVLNSSKIMRLLIPAVTLMSLGIQTILFSFLFSLLGMKRK